MIRSFALFRHVSLALLATSFAATAACAGDASPTAPAATAATSPRFDKNGATNDKFEFTGVTLVDGEQTFENAVIYAASKRTGGGNEHTVCEYSTANGMSYLGQYEEAGVSFTDAAALEQFCIDNFSARQLD
jgi:hypothetical protein